MTGSLAYRKNEAAILRGEVPDKYLRLLPYIPGERILEIGSAEGVLSCLLARKDIGNKKSVMGLERNLERATAATNLLHTWAKKFQFGSVALLNEPVESFANCLPFYDFDTLVAVRMIYYLRDELDTVFEKVARQIPNAVLCGNKNRAAEWRQGIPDRPDGAVNYYASQEGMRALLERHGYSIVQEETEGDPIVVGRRGKF